MVEFRDAVAQQDGRQRERKEFRPVQSEARLGVYRRAHAERDDRYLCIARLHHGPLEQRHVVCRTALTAGLRDDDGGFVEVVASRIERLNQVSHHEGGRIAHFVVGVAQAILRRFVVAFGKLYDFITRLSESGRYER